MLPLSQTVKVRCSISRGSSWLVRSRLLLLLPFARRLHAEAELRRLKIFMTNDVYRIKQCGTLALTKNSLLFAFRQTNQRLYFYKSPSRRWCAVGLIFWPLSSNVFHHVPLSCQKLTYIWSNVSLISTSISLYKCILYTVIILLDLGEPFIFRSFSLHHRIIAADRSASSSASLVRLKLSAWIDVAVRS